MTFVFTSSARVRTLERNPSITPFGSGYQPHLNYVAGT